MKPIELSIAEAAARGRVSRTMIYSAIARKKLSRRYTQGRLVVLEAEFITWRTTLARGGYPRGKKRSAEARANMSLAQKRRWSSQSQ